MRSLTLGRLFCRVVFYGLCDSLGFQNPVDAVLAIIQTSQRITVQSVPDRLICDHVIQSVSHLRQCGDVCALQTEGRVIRIIICRIEILGLQIVQRILHILPCLRRIPRRGIEEIADVVEIRPHGIDSSPCRGLNRLLRNDLRHRGIDGIGRGARCTGRRGLLLLRGALCERLGETSHPVEPVRIHLDVRTLGEHRTSGRIRIVEVIVHLQESLAPASDLRVHLLVLDQQLPDPVRLVIHAVLHHGPGPEIGISRSRNQIAVDLLRTLSLVYSGLRPDQLSRQLVIQVLRNTQPSVAALDSPQSQVRLGRHIALQRIRELGMRRDDIIHALERRGGHEALLVIIQPAHEVAHVPADLGPLARKVCVPARAVELRQRRALDIAPVPEVTDPFAPVPAVEREGSRLGVLKPVVPHARNAHVHPLRGIRVEQPPVFRIQSAPDLLGAYPRLRLLLAGVPLPSDGIIRRRIRLLLGEHRIPVQHPGIRGKTLGVELRRGLRPPAGVDPVEPCFLIVVRGAVRVRVVALGLLGLLPLQPVVRSLLEMRELLREPLHVAVQPVRLDRVARPVRPLRQGQRGFPQLPAVCREAVRAPVDLDIAQGVHQHLPRIVVRETLIELPVRLAPLPLLLQLRPLLGSDRTGLLLGPVGVPQLLQGCSRLRVGLVQYVVVQPPVRPVQVRVLHREPALVPVDVSASEQIHDRLLAVVRPVGVVVLVRLLLRSLVRLLLLTRLPPLLGLGTARLGLIGSMIVPFGPILPGHLLRIPGIRVVGIRRRVVVQSACDAVYDVPIHRESVVSPIHIVASEDVPHDVSLLGRRLIAVIIVIRLLLRSLVRLLLLSQEPPALRFGRLASGPVRRSVYRGRARKSGIGVRLAPVSVQQSAGGPAEHVAVHGQPVRPPLDVLASEHVHDEALGRLGAVLIVVLVRLRLRGLLLTRLLPLLRPQAASGGPDALGHVVD